LIYRPPLDPNSNTVLPGVRHPSSRAAQRRRQRATAPVLRVRRTYLHVPAVARRGDPVASLMGVVAAAPAGNGDGLDGQCMYACSPRQAARTKCVRALGTSTRQFLEPLASTRMSASACFVPMGAGSDGVPAIGRTLAAGVRSCPLKLSSPPQGTTSYR